MLKKNFLRNKGITLIALIITIIVLLILAGVTLSMVMGDSGIFGKANKASTESNKQTATEKINLKITEAQIDTYAEQKRMPTLQELADRLESDSEIKYVTITSQKEMASLAKVNVGNATSIFTKLKDYDYEFEINDRFQLASINGIEIAENTNNNSDITTDNELIGFLKKTNYKLGIEDILTSETAMEKILMSEENINYIVDNLSEYRTKIIKNSAVVRKIADNKSFLEKIIDKEEWRKVIFANNEMISVLDGSNPVTVPKMTSNTSPSGEAFASSAYNGYPAWQAFDTIKTGENYWCVGAGQSYENQYIGYSFAEPIWVYKAEILMVNGKQNTDYVIEASNDKENWTLLKDGLHQSGVVDTIILNNNSAKYKHYRIRMLSKIAQSGNGNTTVPFIQFYGKK